MPRRIVLRRSRQVSELKLRRRPPAGLSGQARRMNAAARCAASR